MDPISSLSVEIHIYVGYNAVDGLDFLSVKFACNRVFYLVFEGHYLFYDYCVFTRL